jgi:excinuclease ABC subunit C
MDVPDTVKEQLKNLPNEPGVYLLKSDRGEILYVGKAKSLKDRVPTYFREGNDDVKYQKLGSLTHSIETIVVSTEEQALEVEYDMIKEHRPKFNISYRDNKRYPYIKITMDETFPRVLTSRTKKPDGARYFGPYTNVGSMRKTLSTIRDIFPYRSCNDDIPEGGDEENLSVCMDYHLKQCEGPCEGLQSAEDYREMIEDLCRFLNGNYEPVRDRLEKKMDEYADNHQYEAAAIYRDRLDALEETVDYKPFVEHTENADVYGIGEAEQVTTVVVLSIRDHRVINRREFSIEAESVTIPEALQDFLVTYYEHHTRLPNQVLVEETLPDQKWVEDRLARMADRSVPLHVPERGEKRNMIESAKRTARLAASNESVSIRRREGDVLSVAKNLFDLDTIPKVIEGFDISTNQGNETVAGMVRFVEGEPEKSGYRRFKIREVDDVDDFEAMREVVRRRYRRLLDEEETLPDLVFVDGGRGQLSAARESLDELSCDLPVVSLAKREELLFVEGREAPYDLPEDSNVLQLFQRIRDEAHRFAISYHRDRRQGMLNSRLTEVDGIGEQRLKAIVEEFGSPIRAKQAPVGDLTEIAGVTPEIARKIKQIE